MIAVGVWTAMLLFTMQVLGLYARGRLVSYAAMAVMLVVIFFLCEKIVLLDRRAFTCKKCGYDLQGLPENRCPECGTDFDPAERERILTRIASPAPKPRHRWIVAVVVALLTFATAGSMVVCRRASRASDGRAAAPTTQQSPTASKGSE